MSSDKYTADYFRILEVKQIITLMNTVAVKQYAGYFIQSTPNRNWQGVTIYLLHSLNVNGAEQL